MEIKEQLEKHFGLQDAICENLNMPTNDVFAVTAPTGRFALKLYNPQSRTATDVQWELDLINHLIKNGAPVVKPIPGKNGYVETFVVDSQNRAAVLFEWATGEKPKPAKEAYELLGKAAAQIHQAAATFHPSLLRHGYDAEKLIDEQLKRMEKHLTAAGKWQQIFDMCERLKKTIENPELDWGICHMDLTLDNVHLEGSTLTVFDFDSAAECWRALEPYKVLRLSKEYFKAWLKGYRSVRPFKKLDEDAVAAFGVIGDLRVVAWDLGVATSSRGTPKIGVSELKDIADRWLEWERQNVSKYKDRRYEILSYDPAWKQSFESQVETLRRVLGDDAQSIEHIGSTSVPGMTGKPTIDILVLVPDLTIAEKHQSEMEALGYEYVGAYVKPDSRLFRKMRDNEVLVNIHLFQPDHQHVKEMLGLRDYLRSHPEEVEAYSKLKEELYEKYPTDYGEYRKQKDVYMAGLIKRVS